MKKQSPDSALDPVELYDAELTCVVDAATQRKVGIGHNGGPSTTLESRLREPSGLRAAWLRFANEVELMRLAVIHLRIEHKKATMADLVGERQRIMNRCTRRMRRAEGKN